MSSLPGGQRVVKMEKESLDQEFLLLDRKAVLETHRRYWAVRRAQDILLSLAALMVLWPFMLLIALVIVLDDPEGGPIFTQVRCGRDGKPFKLYKFRSMCVDAEEKLPALMDQNEMEGPAFKIRNDPRVTRVGKRLRETCLDELPQLWNILKGDMSIVGPRPPLPGEVEQYTEYQRQRLYITPGLTCYWQIQPHRNNINFDTWMELDLKYIQERSFWVDWKIIFRTLKIVFHIK